MNNSTVYLFAANEPVIESSSNLRFAPYNVAYPGQTDHALAAGLKIDENKWDLIFDFTKNQSGDLNFSVMEPRDWQMQKFLEE